MRLCHWGDICTLVYGKAHRDYVSEPSETESCRVFGTNGPIGWTTEPPGQAPAQGIAGQPADCGRDRNRIDAGGRCSMRRVQTLRDIQTELADLNKEATELGARIPENFAELGI